MTQAAWAEECPDTSPIPFLRLDHHTLSGSPGDLVRLRWRTQGAVNVVIRRPRYQEQLSGPLRGAVEIEIGSTPDYVVIAAIAPNGERTTDRCALVPTDEFPNDSGEQFEGDLQ